MTSDFKIVPFQNKFINFFIDLNIEWLEEYFEIEPYDSEILNNCENLITNKGGFIFFGKKNNQIVSTFALIKRASGCFELAKMAVKKSMRDNGYGNKMIEFVITFGKKNKWKEIYLYSSTKLKNSIHLYIKYGFKKVQIKGLNPYKRGDIKMKLMLIN